MGAPEYLSTAQLDKIQDASRLKREPLDFGYTKGRIELEVMLQGNSVTAIEFEFRELDGSGLRQINTELNFNPVG